jgi:hypothetical protein
MATPEADDRQNDVVVEILPLDQQKTEEVRTHRFREKLALGVTIMVGTTIIASFLAAALAQNNAGTVKEIAVAVIPELIVAFGVIIGFYFGTKR